MFHNARLKLTAWYLLIVMLISISFSLVIYRVLSQELERWARSQRLRLEHRLPFLNFSPSDNVMRIINPQTLEQELLDEIKQRLVTTLFFVNLGILALSGGTGYFLAGRTLIPIKDMVEEQYRFVSDASHELRTPLTALKSTLEVHLRDKKLTLSEARILISESIGDVNKLQNLSDALLQLAQYEKPNDYMKLEKTSLQQVVTNAIQRVKPQALQKQIKIVPDILHIDIMANKFGLTDLLVILLDNAIKYSHELSFVAITTSKTDGFINIQVIDTGMGIAKSELPHIFERFFRADSARLQSKSGGYGLGLSIAKKIVDIHHGAIGVKSVINKGTTFSVKIPIK